MPNVPMAGFACDWSVLTEVSRVILSLFRLSASEHHSDGILCTDDAVNVLDFRVPTGIGKKFPTLDEDTQSIFADGDAVYSGAISYKARILDDGATTVMQPQSILNHWSIRQGKLMNVYSLPLSNCHTAQLPITQVWGSSDTIMAANGNGLFVMEPARQYSSGQVISNVRCILGPDELDNPTFDFASSCVLLISRQRPAQWGHWPWIHSSTHPSVLHLLKTFSIFDWWNAWPEYCSFIAFADLS